MKHVTRAAFLADPSVKTPVFVRFSTVAGGAGSADLVRDVRGFAVKFYTSEGNFDLVGNNIPVFFVQDAMKFPDLVHAVKMEPDRAFPQAASAHDTFWDFISLMTVSNGRVNYEPSELDTEGPRESARGFTSHRAAMVGEKARIRPESFADHYTQARLFYRSVTEQEQHHIAAALGFELAKVETLSIRRKMLGHLELVDPRLRGEVAGILGMTEAEFISIEPARPPLDMDPSPALRLYGKYPPTLAGRKVGVLLGDGFDPGLFAALAKAVADAGAVCVAIALKVAGAKDAIGKLHPADTSLAGTPSCLLDAVVLLCGAEGEAALSNDADARQFVTDARRHLKAIGHSGISALAESLRLKNEEGVYPLDGGRAAIGRFVASAAAGKVWSRLV